MNRREFLKGLGALALRPLVKKIPAEEKRGWIESPETECPVCGQYEQGQYGEYPCSHCGLPQLWGKWSVEHGRHASAILLESYDQCGEGYEVTWGVAFGDCNPDTDHYVQCASEEDATKLFHILGS